MSNEDLTKIIVIGIIAIVAGKIFGPVGIAVVALVYLWKKGTKS